MDQLSVSLFFESEEAKRPAHILDLLDGKVRIGRDPASGPLALLVGADVDDDHDRSRRVALHDVVDLQVGRAQFRSRVVPPDQLFPGWRAG